MALANIYGAKLELLTPFRMIFLVEYFNYFIYSLYLDYPFWNYDGSSTGQASGRDSDTFLKPVAVFQDPFLGSNARLVLCDTYNYLMEPTGVI
jgi:hypothetical protein